MLRFLLIPALLITTAKSQIYADFKVSQGGNPLGTFTVTLEHEKAPRTCANFIGLASGKRPWVDVKTSAVQIDKPYYDGLTFHRLIHSFVIQGGSPDGTGGDGPGYSILDEYNPLLRHSGPYVLSMAKSSFPNTGGSQFFITLRATPELNDKHSVFGTVTAGTAIIDSFKNVSSFPTDSVDKPITPIIMDSVKIYGPSYASFNIDAPNLRLPEVNSTNFTPVRTPETGNFKLVFDRRAKTDYLFRTSTDLATWSSAGTLFSLDAFPNFQYGFGTPTSQRFFVNGATVRYDLIPDSPADLKSADKYTVRLRYPGNVILDLILTPTFSVWDYRDSTGNTIAGGFLNNVVWSDKSPLSGFYNEAESQSFNLPLGQLSVTFDSPAGPEGLTSLNTWLSFHTPTAGWLEEISNNPARRLPFQLIGN